MNSEKIFCQFSDSPNFTKKAVGLHFYSYDKCCTSYHSIQGSAVNNYKIALAVQQSQFYYLKYLNIKMEQRISSND